MHHRFEIVPASEGQASRVLYRSHKGAPDLEQRIADVGDFPPKLFSFAQRQRDTDPCANIFRKIFTSFSSLGDAVAAMNSRERSNKLTNVSVTMTPDFPGITLPGGEKTGEGEKSGPRVIVSKTDANILQVLDATTLEPLDLLSYAHIDPRLSGQLSAAHACRDAETGDFYNFVAEMAMKTTWKVFKIRGDNGKAEVLATFSGKDAPPTYIHAMTMTDRFVIVCVWQAHIRGFGLALLSTHNIADSIEKTWNPKFPSVFYVVDRHNGGLVAKYKVANSSVFNDVCEADKDTLQTDPFFAFHYVNAYDDPETGDVVIDLSVYPNTGVLDMLYLDKMRDTRDSKPWMGRARRFRLSDPAKVAEKGSVPVLDAKIDFTLPQSVGVELPTLAPGKHHHAYQYAYGITRRPVGKGFSDGIIKLDMKAAVTAATASEPLEGKESEYAKIWRLAGHAPSEPIFAPRPGGASEDDGVFAVRRA
ncbi:hypothetical protein EVJ58_g3311 [Rhodofomes roseus]|uniref:Carotenoid oxygenase n=1 Tax=Rhodofomes roseus TaxID=34475 RepID=A0A4Y9YN99_9APHY|nr:hypothetical protein EVJ58_g3311 [Rhodofomes roseus]